MGKSEEIIHLTEVKKDYLKKGDGREKTHYCPHFSRHTLF